MPQPRGLVVSVMLAVDDAPTAVAWYKQALGATELWSLGSVAGLEIAGAPFFVGEPANNGWESPRKLGITSTRVEIFCDDPDTFIACAVQAGANGDVDPIRNHQMPWGIHRQGGFIDPFGHIWLVGDTSPLKSFPSLIAAAPWLNSSAKVRSSSATAPVNTNTPRCPAREALHETVQSAPAPDSAHWQRLHRGA